MSILVIDDDQDVRDSIARGLLRYGFEVRTAPDMATISLGVMTEAKTAVEAMRQNATRMTEVVASLRRSGIAEKDIQTSNLNLSAQYHYEAGRTGDAGERLGPDAGTSAQELDGAHGSRVATATLEPTG